MASSSNVTQDHEEIRRWAEERGAVPTCVKGTGGKGDTGVLRLEFPGSGSEDSLQEISWENWFEKFDERNLALLYQEETAEGQKSNFNKIVSAETAAENEERSGGRSHSRAGKTAAKKPGAKKTAAKKAAAKKSAPAAKKSAVKKSAPAAKKSAVKKSAGAAKKTAAKKTAAKKTVAKKAVKKAPAAKRTGSKTAQKAATKSTGKTSAKSSKKTASKTTNKSSGGRR